LVDTSAGAPAAADSWSSASLADVNSRIAEGVIGVNISGSAPNATNIGKLTGLNALSAPHVEPLGLLQSPFQLQKKPCVVSQSLSTAQPDL
jgi:hypothetical protein